MHAEMLAIRGFKHFILTEISQETSQYFEWVQKKKKFKLRDKYQCLLYCSEIFCGDCCVNKELESFSGAKPLKSFGDEKYSQAKYEANILRTKPGRLDLPKQKRSPVLSCSDLLAFFNLVGIQGKDLFNTILPIYLSLVIVDCPDNLKPTLERGLDFVTRIGHLRGKSKGLILRQLFNIVVEGKQRKISGQFRRNRPQLRVLHKENENKDRNQEGFQLCGVFIEGKEEWINGRSGIPEGASLNKINGKGKISQFSDHSLRANYPIMDRSNDSFKYEAVENRLKWLFGQWISDLMNDE